MTAVILTVLCATGATVAVLLGAHVYGWEELAWAWTAVIWCLIARAEAK